MKSLTSVILGIIIYFITCIVVVFYSFNFISFIGLITSIYFITKGCINTTN